MGQAGTVTRIGHPLCLLALTSGAEPLLLVLDRGLLDKTRKDPIGQQG